MKSRSLPHAVHAAPLFVFIGLTLAYSLRPWLPSFAPPPTTAHWVLKMEAELERERPDCRQLDSILAEAKRRIEPPTAHTRRQAAETLRTIHQILKDRNFTAVDTIMLLSESLAPPGSGHRRMLAKRLGAAGEGADPAWKIRRANCDTLSFIYLAVAESLELPLSCMSLPEHIYVRWTFDDGSHLDWETTTGGPWKPEIYAAVVGVPLENGELAIAPHQMTEAELRAESYAGRGWGWLERGKPQKALADLTRAIKLNPTHSQAYNNRAVAHRQMGAFQQALADASHAIRQNPYCAAAYSNRGNAHLASGHPAQALADYNRAIALRPDDASYYNNRGSLHFRQGRHAAALEDFNRAIGRQPRHAPAYLNRAVHYMRQEQYARAIADLTTVISLNPESASAHRRRAQCHEHLGNQNQAKTDRAKHCALKAAFANSR